MEHCPFLLYSFVRIVNRNSALLYCIYYHVETSAWNMSACWSDEKHRDRGGGADGNDCK